MSRKILLLLVLGLVGGFVVAFVRAQDGAGDASPGASKLDDGIPSVLVPAASARSRDAGKSSPSATKHGSSLADRLKRIRENADEEDAAAQDLSAPATIDVKLEPKLPAASPANKPAAIGAEVSDESEPKSFDPGSPLDNPKRQLPAILERPKAEPQLQTSDEFVPRTESRSPAPMSFDPASSATSRRPDQLPVDKPSAFDAGPQPPIYAQPDRPSIAPRNEIRAVPSSESHLALSSRGPSLRVDVAGPRTVIINKEVTYTVTVVNTGDAQARGIIVSLGLPTWVAVQETVVTAGEETLPVMQGDRLTWTIDAVAPRAQQQLTIKAVAQQTKPFEMMLDWRFAAESSAARIQVHEPLLELSLSGPQEMLFGEIAKYTIALSNPGTGHAENVTVTLSDELGGGQTLVGTVPAGGRKELTVQMVARKAGEVEVRADAQGDGGLQASAASKTLVRRAALEVVASGPQFKYAGSSARYELTVINSGDAVAEDVVAAAALPVGAKVITTPEGGQLLDGGVRWLVGRLEPGDQRRFQVDCELTVAGENRLEAGVRGRGDLSATGAAVTRVEALADLKLIVNDPQGPQPVGQDVEYEILVLNRGTKAARHVEVVAQFSDGIEPISVEGGRADLIPGQVLFDPIASLEAGGEVRLRISSRAHTAGNHIFRTEVKCRDPESRQVSEDTTRYFGDDVPRANNGNSASRRIGRGPAPAAGIELRK